MNRLAILAVSLGLLAGTQAALAQDNKGGSPNSGQSQFAPGQKQTEPGTAKDFAPGQKQNEPGTAKKFAPGQQEKTPNTK